MQYWEIMDGITRQQMSCLDFSDCKAKYGDRAVTIHRVDLHKELQRLALEGEDNPASLTLASTVEAVDEQGYVTLNNGTKLHADLIIGADGVHSTTRKTVLDGELQAPAATDVSAFRLLIPTSKLKDKESLTGLLKAKVQGSTLIADTSEKVKERHIIVSHVFLRVLNPIWAFKGQDFCLSSVYSKIKPFRLSSGAQRRITDSANL